MKTHSNGIRIPRLERELNRNELRDYLANKLETGRILQELPNPQLRPYRKAFEHVPRVLLLSPSISIPRYMQKRCIPPLGLCYIAASLEKQGYQVSMLDCCLEGYHAEQSSDGLLTYGLDLPALAERLDEFDPDVIGISVLFSNDLQNALEMAHVAKKRFPKALIVIGGLHPTIYPLETFQMAKRIGNGIPCIDWIIRGEGEDRLVQFIEQIRHGQIDVHADGLVGYVDGETICNHQYASIQHLDDLPFPAYHLLPMEKYFEINVPFSPVPQGQRVIQMLTSRGCPIGCSFCASTNLYKQYRHRSGENILAELKLLIERYNIDEIQFADDNLTLLPRHISEVLMALKEVDVAWCTPNGTMVNTLSEELLIEMRESGLYQITLSIDSGSARTLKNLHHKPVNLSRVPHLIELCERIGVWTHGTLVIGMPGESWSDIREGLNFVLENLPFTSISTFIAQPIPGSELYHQALEANLIQRTESFKTDSTRCKMHLEGMASEELEEAASNFQQKFTDAARLRRPDVYQKKYQRLIQQGRLNPQSSGRLA